VSFEKPLLQREETKDMSLSMKNMAVLAVLVFSLLSLFLFIQHEIHLSEKLPTLPNAKRLHTRKGGKRVGGEPTSERIEKTLREMVAILNDLKEKEDAGGAGEEEEVEEFASLVANMSGLGDDVYEEEVPGEFQDDELEQEVDDDYDYGTDGASGNAKIGKESSEEEEEEEKQERGEEKGIEGKEEEEEEEEPESAVEAETNSVAVPNTNKVDVGKSSSKADKQQQASLVKLDDDVEKPVGVTALLRKVPLRVETVKKNEVPKTEVTSQVAATVVKATPPPPPLPPTHLPPVKNSTSRAFASSDSSSTSSSSNTVKQHEHEPEKKGVLYCDGKQVDSEVIYWKIVPGDNEYESPITPHHSNHDDKYLTFEYDNGGWNNVRMGVECVIVMAHAMGRTLVVPPQQHLYLLGKTHKDKEDAKAHDEMGFDDMFNIEYLRKHKGMNIMSMKAFLEKEALTGGLHGVFPPNNDTDIWGAQLWSYLDKVGDLKPEWMGRYLAMPSHPGDFTLAEHNDPKMKQRLAAFGGDRSPVFYDEVHQKAHHLHFPGDDTHRLLQHHYAFAFFADPEMQSFYRRFVRDYMRYRDEIQCAGSELVAAVRQEALKLDPNGGGVYYALHVRRGDFQFKEVKIGAPEIVKNLRSPSGQLFIPPGALVYLSTDDPEGLCKNCMVQRQPCESYPAGKKPVGCPEDTTWNAFHEAGWKVRFLHHFTSKGALKDVNPNLHGMVESIVCSRAKVFAGTYFSTFTGYIHRLRGYHGLGEATYYHSTGHGTKIHTLNELTFYPAVSLSFKPIILTFTNTPTNTINSYTHTCH